MSGHDIGVDRGLCRISIRVFIKDIIRASVRDSLRASLRDSVRAYFGKISGSW